MIHTDTVSYRIFILLRSSGILEEVLFEKFGICI